MVKLTVTIETMVNGWARAHVEIDGDDATSEEEATAEAIRSWVMVPLSASGFVVDCPDN